MKNNEIISKQNCYLCLFCGKTYISLPPNGTCFHCKQKRMKYINLEIRDPHKLLNLKISYLSTLNNIRDGNLWFKSPKEFHDYSGEGSLVRKDDTDSKYSHVDEYVQTEDQEIDNYRILCFYSLNINNKGQFLQDPDIRISDFGDYFSIIDTEGLSKWLQDYLLSNGLKVSLFDRNVYYLLDKYTGPYSPFCKPQRDNYQYEFRFVLHSHDSVFNDIEPFKIQTLTGFKEFFSNPIEISYLFSTKNYDDLYSLIKW